MIALTPSFANGTIQAHLPKCVVAGISKPELIPTVDPISGETKVSVRKFFITVAMRDAEGETQTQNLWIGNIWDADQASAELEYWENAIASKNVDILVLEDQIVTTRSIKSGSNPFWQIDARTRSGSVTVDTDLLDLLG